MTRRKAQDHRRDDGGEAGGAEAGAGEAGGAEAGTGDGPERRCIVTGRVGPRTEMIRFVTDPDDEVVPDIDARLPGRGFWLSAGRDVVETAIARKLFAKAARRAVTVSPDLADRVERLLARKVVDMLGLARRAGLVVAGYEKVHAALKAGRAGLLLEAGDAAAGGREKLRRLGPRLPLVDVLDGAEMGSALGRDLVVHVAVRPGRMAGVLLREASRLAHYRGKPVPKDVPEAAEERLS
ncbi:MAG: RNA-binding protein [Alphaproteobacteria bacterium]